MYSLDARSGRPIQVSLLERIRAILGGRLVIPNNQKMQRGLGVMLGIEGNINASLHLCQAKEFALAGAVFDQEVGGVRHHYRVDIRMDYAGRTGEILKVIIFMNIS